MIEAEEDRPRCAGKSPTPPDRGFRIRDVMLSILWLGLALGLGISASKPAYREGWIVSRVGVRGRIAPPFGSSRAPIGSREANVRRATSSEVIGAASALEGGRSAAERLFVCCDVASNTIFFYLKSADPDRDRPIVDALTGKFAEVSGGRVVHSATTLRASYPYVIPKLILAACALVLAAFPGVKKLGFSRRIRAISPMSPAPGTSAPGPGALPA